MCITLGSEDEGETWAGQNEHNVCNCPAIMGGRGLLSSTKRPSASGCSVAVTTRPTFRFSRVTSIASLTAGAALPSPWDTKAQIATSLRVSVTKMRGFVRVHAGAGCKTAEMTRRTYLDPALAALATLALGITLGNLLLLWFGGGRRGSRSGGRSWCRSADRRSSTVRRQRHLLYKQQERSVSVARKGEEHHVRRERAWD